MTHCIANDDSTLLLNLLNDSTWNDNNNNDKLITFQNIIILNIAANCQHN